MKHDPFTSWDVSIIGGGPAGVSLGLLLARAGLSVLVLEIGKGEDDGFAENFAPSAKPVLQGLGAWQAFRDGIHLPCLGSRTVWGSNTPKVRPYLEGPGHGWCVDRGSFFQMLLTYAQEAGVYYERFTRIKAFEKSGGEDWSLQLQTGSRNWKTRARLVVDAAGRRSPIAGLLGAKRRNMDRLVGYSLILPHRPTVSEGRFFLVESAKNGWWYSIPEPSGGRTVIFLTDDDLPSSDLAQTLDGWRSLFLQTSAEFILDARAQFPTKNPRKWLANSSALTSAAGEGWLAVGDAAAAYDPLSSQGLLSALISAFHAKDAITTWFRGNQDALASYAGLIEMAYRDYHAQRLNFYRLEDRWLEDRFWQRRHRDPDTQDKKQNPVRLIPFSLD